jgi:MFS family permease
VCPAVIALDLQEAFDVGGTLLGVLGSAYFYPYALMQLPAGLRADSWGPRRLVSSFLVLAAAGSLLMAAAPGVGWAVAGRVLVGVGVSTVFVSNFKVLAEWFPPRRFAVMGGMFMFTGGVGALSAGIPLAWASGALGWRMTLVAVAAATLLMAALDFALVRDRPAGTPRGGQGPPGEARDARPPAPSVGIRAGMRLVATARRFWILSVWAFLGMGIAFAVGGLWGGPYLMQVYGLTKAEAGGVLSTFALGLMAGGPLLTWLTNCLGRKPVLLGCSAALAAVCGVLWAFTDGLSIPALYVLFFVLFVAGAAPGPVIATVSKELFPRAIAGTSVGMVNLFPFFGGALLQVLAGAIVSGAQGGVAAAPAARYHDMFLLFFLASLASFFLGFFLEETLDRQRP